MIHPAHPPSLKQDGILLDWIPLNTPVSYTVNATSEILVTPQLFFTRALKWRHPGHFLLSPLNSSCEIHDRFRHGSSEFWSWVGEPYAFVHVHGRLRLCLWYLREYGACPCLLSVLWQQWAVIIFIFCCCSRHPSLYTLVHYVIPLFIVWCGTDSVLEDKPVQA